jgi:hypothetical protein
MSSGWAPLWSQTRHNNGIGSKSTSSVGAFEDCCGLLCVCQPRRGVIIPMIDINMPDPMGKRMQGFSNLVNSGVISGRSKGHWHLVQGRSKPRQKGARHCRYSQRLVVGELCSSIGVVCRRGQIPELFAAAPAGRLQGQGRQRAPVLRVRTGHSRGAAPGSLPPLRPNRPHPHPGHRYRARRQVLLYISQP